MERTEFKVDQRYENAMTDNLTKQYVQSALLFLNVSTLQDLGCHHFSVMKKRITLLNLLKQKLFITHLLQ